MHTSHAQATDTTSEYTWPTCTACSRPLRDTELGRYACGHCHDRAATRLGELGDLFTRLNTTTALLPATRRPGPAPTGTRTPPLPCNPNVLNLTAPGGVAARLQAIEDAWRRALGRRIGTWAGNPRQAVPVHLDFLRINLDRMCATYPEIADDLDEIRRLHTEITHALTPDTRPGRINIGPCPAVPPDTTEPCGAPLTATTGTHRIHCTACGTHWDDLAAWRTLRAAQDAALRAAQPAAA